MLQDLAEYLVKLDRDMVYALTQEALDADEDPIKIIEVAQKGMETVGEKYNSGEFYLAELMLSGKIFQTLMEMINPSLTQDSTQTKIGKILLATPEGDIHDLGKSIVATMFTADGWEVVDLGANVPIDQIVSKTAEIEPDILGISCLLSTAFDGIKQTAEQLAGKGLRDNIKLVIGGGVTNESTRTFVGADFQCTDVMDGLAYCRKAIGEE